MKPLEIAYVTPRRERLKSTAAQELLNEYLLRSRRFAAVDLSAHASEEALLAHVDRLAAKGPVLPVLLDSRGRMLSSEAFADHLRSWREDAARATLAIGPADGWSPAARSRAGLLLSLGPMTMPHELALVMLAEQLYRGFTILAGHPYHGGHA